MSFTVKKLKHGLGRWVMGLALAPLAAQGATTGASAATVEAEPSRWIGSMELRSYYSPKSGVINTDNYLELGYRITEESNVSYVQFFSTNLVTPGVEKGLDLKFYGGFLRGNFRNLWQPDPTLSMAYQPRVYLPLSQADRDRGQIAVMRNYFTFTKRVTDRISVSAVEMPVFQFYSQAGSVVNGEAVANPLFENRIYLIGSFQLSEKLSFSLPLYFHTTWHRDYAPGAANNADVTFFFYTWPEFAYALTPNASLLVAYNSDNLIAGDLSGLTLGEGFGNGSVQVALSLSL